MAFFENRAAKKLFKVDIPVDRNINEYKLDRSRYEISVFYGSRLL